MRGRPAPESTQNCPGLLLKDLSAHTLCRLIALEKEWYSRLQANSCYNKIKGEKLNNFILAKQKINILLAKYNQLKLQAIKHPSEFN